MNYAKNTSVSVDKSQQDIARLLRRAGAEKCLNGWDDNSAFVAFVLKGIPIKMKIEMPSKDQFLETETGRTRAENRVYSVWEQFCWQKMREFCLLLKAKLVAVSIGFRTVEHEFYSDICLPTEGGATIFEVQGNQLEQIIKTGKLQPLLPGL